MEGTFIFITSDVELVEFQEATTKGARILATFMELETPSSNDRIYRIEEGARIAKSLIGKPIRYGFNWLGRHIKDTLVLGVVEKAWQEGKKIKGIVNLFDKGIIETLKAGTKYLFSVGGVAEFNEVIQKGRKLFYKLYNAVCTHLQLLPNNPKSAGFPSAKMEKILEINESRMWTDYDVLVCDQLGTCKILKGIKNEFEEAKRVDEEIENKIINKVVAEDIAEIIKRVPKLFFDEKV